MEELADPVSHLNVECSIVSCSSVNQFDNHIWSPPQASDVKENERGVFLRLVFELEKRHTFELYVGVGSIDAFLDMEYDVQVVISSIDSFNYPCICCGSTFSNDDVTYVLDFHENVHSSCWDSLEEVIAEYCEDNSELLVANSI